MFGEPHRSRRNRRKRTRNVLSSEQLESRQLLSAHTLSLFEPLGPDGGLAQHASTTGVLEENDVVDIYHVELQSGQSFAATASSFDEGEISLSLVGPDGALLTDDSGDGDDIIAVQATSVPTAGTYDVVVTGTVEKKYQIDVYRDVAIESEFHTGESNDSLATAESVDGLFRNLSSGDLASIQGTMPFLADQFFARDGFEDPLGPEWELTSSVEPSGVSRELKPRTIDGSYVLSFLTSGDGSTLNEATLTVDLTGASDVDLEFTYLTNDSFEALPATFVGNANGDGVSISDDGENWFALPIEFNADSRVHTVTVDLDEAIADAGLVLNALQANFQIRFQIYHVGQDLSLTFLDSIEVAPVDAKDIDWYEFTLSDGENVSLSVANDNSLDYRLELYDASGNHLATSSMNEPDHTRIIHGFVDPTNDGQPNRYYGRVLGGAGGYTLAIARNTLLESDTTEQTLDGVNSVIGSLISGPVFDPITFAVIGDWGSPNAATTYLAEMITAGDWDTEFITTAGDNMYREIALGSPTWEQIVGARFGDYIKRRADNRYPFQTSETARFFPTVGNHDGTATGTGQTGRSGGLIPGYIDYFVTDPGQPDRIGDNTGYHGSDQSFYDVRWGPIHLFAIDSDHARVDESSLETQKAWLEAKATASDASWKFVVFHHSPYSSSASHGNQSKMQWDFAHWDIDAVFSGHDHIYERIIDPRDGMLYFVTGLGGSSRYQIGSLIEGSQFAFNEATGATRVTVEPNRTKLELVTTTVANGEVLDEHTIFHKTSDNSDRYSVTANAGDELRIALRPTTGSSLNATFKLLTDSGQLLANGINGSINYSVAETGDYLLLVESNGTAGSYELTVDGASSATSPRGRFAPIETIKADQPYIDVNLDSPVSFATVDAADLTVNGLAAIAVEVVDGQTLRFQLPELAVDEATLRIDSGAIENLNGMAYQTMTIDVEIDPIAPVVIQVDTNRDEAERPDQFRSVFIEFNEDVSASLKGADIKLWNQSENRSIPVVIGWSANVLEITAPAATPGRYSLSILADAVTDVAGNALDGNLDGVAGGEFITRFRVNLPGDADLDGIVDEVDFQIWEAFAFTGPANIWAQGDFNNDGVTDGSDFNIWNQNRSMSINAVPRTPRAAQAVARRLASEIRKLEIPNVKTWGVPR